MSAANGPALPVLRRLEACLQEEIAAQGRALELLASEETALLARDPAAVLQQTHALERELTGGVERGRRRAEILRTLAAAFGVAPAALTLGSIAERLESDPRLAAEGERLRRMRGELRERTARVQKTARKLASLAMLHQRYLSDVIQALFESVGARDAAAGGQLLDAEA